jgi:hypothetical protein
MQDSEKGNFRLHELPKKEISFLGILRQNRKNEL